MPKTLQAALLIEVLDLGIKVGTFDEVLFREYLQMPLTQQGFKQRPKVQAPQATKHVDASHWNRYIGNVQQSQKPAATSNSSQPSWDNTQSEMIRKYLEHFCAEKDGSLDDFKDDFDTAFLRAIEERVAIYSAEAGEGLTKL